MWASAWRVTWAAACAWAAMRARCMPGSHAQAWLQSPVPAPGMQLQGVLGYLLFAEQLSMRWALGAVLVVAGLVLISQAAAPPASSSTQRGAATKAQGAGKED